MARARNTDPGTSHQAAARFDASGAGGSHVQQCLAVLARHPEGLTATAIAAGTNGRLTQVQVCRRLKEMRDDGAIHAVGEPDGEQVWKLGAKPTVAKQRELFT